MSEVTPKQAFLNEWNKVAQPVPGDKLGRRQIGLCMAKITDGGKDYADLPDTVYLDDITSVVPKRGFGAQAMGQILSLADKFGVTVNLHADPNDPKRSPTTEKLQEFYGRFGFVQDGEGGTLLHKMTRAPRSGPSHG